MMRDKALKRSGLFAFASLFCLVAGAWNSALMAADHLDSPRVRTNGRLDINDVYLFNAPGSTNRVVIAVTLAPNAGILSPQTFDPTGFYEIAIDLDGNSVEDAVIRATFSQPNNNGVQAVRFRMVTRAAGAFELGRGLTNANLRFRLRQTDVRARAGLFDDPFFFDLAAFQRFVANGNPAEFGSQTTNFFRTFNTLAIVVEVPTALLGLPRNDPTIGVWARTIQGGAQFERMGFPVVNTVLIKPDSSKDAFNSGHPSNDRAAFGAISVNTLTTPPYNQSLQHAQFVTNFLLPDVLPLDLSSPNGFPNGRRLQDDVIDTALGLASNGGITTDFVGNDSTFRASFPYLGTPQPR